MPNGHPLLGGTLDSAVSSYHGLTGGKLHRIEKEPSAVTPLVSFVYDSFASLVNSEHFPCLGARSAIRRETLRFGVYPTIGSAVATLGLLSDLWKFTREFPAGADGFATFVAAFEGPPFQDERTFEDALWAQLQQLHDLDSVVHVWDPEVSSDPEDPGFSFSVGERALFVIGLHPAASRWARRFSWPVLVFNPHDQFQELRRTQRMDRMTNSIRKRDAHLQGEHNPMSEYHGQSSEALQYSGRRVEPDEWNCPFQPRGGLDR